ncbi:TetR/AcrR family transcriptional regulator [Actinoplanes flavus]|uniref:TetR/AcrR family transcriptional regulator n=1 Tax=Actinoplanes flavus TaxID=2820290 RepID=A0ABS3UFZ4_9ACTN|nr:TetR/AcrR family transcriptional regulator [Actinoplanes flavus]MBO3737695.1 TetR/AcrR family transcriptional regulator [Actinoplanes flavus]
MPKLWNSTVEQHRHTVHAAILDATAALIAEHGLAVNMSQIAAHVGIGRATLYKYFPDVQAIVAAWHERQVTAHLDHLTSVAAQHQDPGERLRTVLSTYLRLSSTGTHTGHGNHGGGPAAQLATALHQASHMPAAHQRLRELVTAVIAGAADAGVARTDVPTDELATYCLHALAAAAALPSPGSHERLLEVTWAGLLPPR